jgi:hypothetical protein
VQSVDDANAIMTAIDATPGQRRFFARLDGLVGLTGHGLLLPPDPSLLTKDGTRMSVD